MSKNYDILFKALLVSCLAVLFSYLWQGSKGFNLWDEGFLWYGVQRVLSGEVPIRDFLAYDPGRYYWSAAWISLFGDDGIMSVRAATAVFQALGLFVGFFLVVQPRKDADNVNFAFWLIAIATLIVWMFPRHKLFDISISLFLIGILTFLVSQPTPRRYLVTGACIGLIAVFGRNHGVYGALGSFGVIVWLSIKNQSDTGFIKAIVFWGLGIIIGFSPIFLMAFLIPGFGVAFYESIRFLFEYKATNIPLPVPWPWTVNFSAVSFGNAARGVLIGLFFIGILVFAVLSILWVVYCKFKDKQHYFLPPALVATAFLSFPYAHYAFSRADVGHLALGIFPFLVGCFILLTLVRSGIRWFVAITLCIASFWTVHTFHPGWQCFASKEWADIEIAGKTLKVDPGTANDILLLRGLADQFSPERRAFIAAPFWPGAYALLERKSPMWEIYALYPRLASFERKEIDRIRASRPGFAFILDIPLDGREELRFRNTHPLINQYILDNFERLPISQNPAYQIYKARDAAN